MQLPPMQEAWICLMNILLATTLTELFSVVLFQNSRTLTREGPIISDKLTESSNSLSLSPTLQQRTPYAFSPVILDIVKNCEWSCLGIYFSKSGAKSSNFEHIYDSMQEYRPCLHFSHLAFLIARSVLAMWSVLEKKEGCCGLQLALL